MIDTKFKYIIDEISGELKKKFSNFLGFYIFGSQARGNSNDESDYDIAIVFDQEID